jgi:predicted DNA-binding transcriptional regulator AlpA
VKKPNRRPPPPRHRPVKALPPAPVVPKEELPTLEKSKRWLDRDRMLQRTGPEGQPKNYVTVWRWMKKGTFPLPYIVGDRNLWLESEIDDWQASRTKRQYLRRAEA